MGTYLAIKHIGDIAAWICAVAVPFASLVLRWRLGMTNEQRTTRGGSWWIVVLGCLAGLAIAAYALSNYKVSGWQDARSSPTYAERVDLRLSLELIATNVRNKSWSQGGRFTWDLFLAASIEPLLDKADKFKLSTAKARWMCGQVDNQHLDAARDVNFDAIVTELGVLAAQLPKE